MLPTHTNPAHAGLAGMLAHAVAGTVVDAVAEHRNPIHPQILRMLGYRTDVVEFVSTEHTPRNLLIRAVKAPGGALQLQQQRGQQQQQLVEEYEALKEFWGGVTPHLEELLAAELAGQLTQGP
jgi:hypothetical protein